MGKSKREPRRHATSGDFGDIPLADLLNDADRIFWCNTNRYAPEPGYCILEQRMHTHQFAAAWITFNYPTHMQRVERSQPILMYANDHGVIGVGIALGNVEVLGRNASGRLRPYAEGHHTHEWRIRVEWRVWNEHNPCAVPFLRSSFQEITHLDNRWQPVLEHAW